MSAANQPARATQAYESVPPVPGAAAANATTGSAPAGATTALAATAPAHVPAPTWPQGISRSATMRISDVLAELRADFPAVTSSKLRFLEEQGLVQPVRTPSGYRQYSPADVERLRYVLRQQRDRYLPLRVIREHLSALDAGTGEGAGDAEVDGALHPRLATSDGVPAQAARGGLTAQVLAEDAGVPDALVHDLVAAGVIRPATGDRFDPWVREVVVLAGMLAEHGIDARHLRTFKAAADRQVGLVEQVVAPVRGQGAASSAARAGTLAAELGELCAQLHTALIRAGVADLPG